MSRWKQALSTAFNVRHGEGEALVLLAVHSFFGGLCFVLFETAANTLFLSAFGVESLPYVYMATAAVATTTGALYLRCERVLTPSRPGCARRSHRRSSTGLSCRLQTVDSRGGEVAEMARAGGFEAIAQAGIEARKDRPLRDPLDVWPFPGEARRQP